VLSAIDSNRTAVVVNSAEVFPGDIERNPDFILPAEEIKQAIRGVSGPRIDFLDVTALALALLGDSIAANIFMLGFAWQRGYLPLSDKSILRAIELNGESVPMNHQAFKWGRQAAHDLGSVQAVARSLRAKNETREKSKTLEEVIERRAAFLVDYQNAAYARRYQARVERAISSRSCPPRMNTKSRGFIRTVRFSASSTKISKAICGLNCISRRRSRSCSPRTISAARVK